MEMKPCQGCLKCRPDGKCVLPEDDVHRLGDKIKYSDYIIIGSPCYWGNMPGTLKIFFDRNVTTFEHFRNGLPSPVLKGKKVLLIITSGAPFSFNLPGS